MKRTLRMMVLASAVLVSAGVVSFAADMNDPTAVPVTPADAAARTSKDIIKDVQALSAELKEKVGPMAALLKPEGRKELAPVAIPLLKKFIALMNELAASDAKYTATAVSQKSEISALLILLGDADTTKGMEETAKGTGDSAIAAKLTLATAQWWSQSTDAVAQGKVLDGLTELAKAHPADDSIARTLMTIASTNAANEDLSGRAKDIIASDLTGKVATALKTQIQGEQKLAANVGKPLVIAGKTQTGDAFTTADWKGKVILVDFWATWCGPCKAELPRVKQVYKDFHSKGFEVLGVSNDYAAEDLTKFLAADPEMPWPSLFDADAAAEHKWNPITTGFGINGIPVMFLIDKKGILRSVTAREDFEKLIPKYLGE